MSMLSRMKAWEPQWSITPPPGSAESLSYYGGVAEGLPADRWPVCDECGVVMTPLLQLSSGPWIPRIPEDQVLLAFKCEGEDVCSFWEVDVANRCVLVPSNELMHNVDPPRSVASGETRILPRFWVTEWISTDDGVDDAYLDAMNDPIRYWDLPEEIQVPHDFKSEKCTKAGGAPYWTGNGPSDEPPLPRELLFQIDNCILISDSAEALSEYLEAYDGHTVVHQNLVESANFMTDGIGYVFDVTPDDPVPTPKMVINR